MLDELMLEGGGSSHSRHSNSSGGANINSSAHKVDSYNYAGNGGKTEIHHVVEQCQVSKSGFSNQQVQASTNKVELDYNLHRRISGFYSSRPPEYGGLRVRDWLAGQSFEAQTAFGWYIVNKYYSQLLG